MRCVACSWSQPTGASRIYFGGHLSSGSHHRSPLSSLSFPSSCVVSCSSTSGPSDLKNSSNRSYSRRWYNPLPRRRHADQMPTSRIARDWIDSDTSPVSEDSERFTVVSYNILGDRNSSYHKDLYSNVSFPYLKWGYRKRLICEELIRLRPDIICLQEVDKYFDLFSIMEKAGFAGSYKRRTGDNIDGCAMFWKTDRFRVLERENIEFSQFGMRDNVAQLSVLELRRSKSRKLLVGNIHVLYNPSRGDVKLGQIRSLCSKAHLLSKKWGDIPIVLGGDYNSLPQSPLYNFLASSELNIMKHDKRELSGQRNRLPNQVLEAGSKPSDTIASISTPLYNFLASSELNIMKHDKRELSGQRNRLPNQVLDAGSKPSDTITSISSSWTSEEIRLATGQENSYWAVHPLKLHSSYASVKGSTNTRDSLGEPLATKPGLVVWWYSDGVAPARVLDTLPIDVLCKTRGLPCQELGSDHLALVSEFFFEPNG